MLFKHGTEVNRVSSLVILFFDIKPDMIASHGVDVCKVAGFCRFCVNCPVNRAILIVYVVKTTNNNNSKNEK